MKFCFWSVVCALLPATVVAQTGTILGTVTDSFTGETLPMVPVTYADGKGVATDLEGRFSFTIPYGTYNISVVYSGYEKMEKTVSLNQAEVEINFELNSVELKEVVISSDFAIGRETPVAFSNIPLKRLEEELGSREVATIINTVPGTYVTQQGGGDGDARVTIRGFSQNNVAVMLDGVPVNDMENGWVYWSNWFGLDVVLQTTQVQRGLGASKLAIPAVGGTINLITKGIEQKKFVRLKHEAGDNGFMRTTLGISSGKMENGWGFTLAGSIKRGNGWVDGTVTRGIFWYGKVEKITGKHLISLSALGAPQRHGQRVQHESIAVFDPQFAVEQGIDTTGIPNYGLSYNMHVGPLTAYDVIAGERINEQSGLVNERVNYYHKPQFALKDVWRFSDKNFLSTVAYLSLGHGGGTRLDQNPNPASGYLEDGRIDFQTIYDTNSGLNPPLFSGDDYNINYLVSSTERYAFNYIKSSVNNHFWYGALSIYSHELNEKLSIGGGLDYRSYTGEHYREVYDLLGADYIQKTDDFDANNISTVKREGDKIEYHNDAFVQWGGLFGQAEYKSDLLTGFVSASVSRTGYMRADYFLPCVIIGTDVEVGYHLDQGNPDAPELIPDSVYYNGQLYTPTGGGLEYQRSAWIVRDGFTVKAGININATEDLNVFVNFGYLNKAPLFNQVFDFGNQPFGNVINEKIIGNELGIAYSDEDIAANFNSYYTVWNNRPFPGGFAVPDPLDPLNTIQINLQGINARHAGAEFDFAYNITHQLTAEGLVSYGDWIWNSAGEVQPQYDDGTPVVDANGDPYIISYDAKGIHVGNAAQTQYGAMMRWEIMDELYLKLRYIRFERQYAEFEPTTLTGDNAGRDSWLAPAYGLAELHAGYGFRLNSFEFDLRASVFNVLNTVYVSDANNNDSFARFAREPDAEFSGFTAQSAGVFIGQGRRFNISLTITY